MSEHRTTLTLITSSALMLAGASIAGAQTTQPTATTTTRPIAAQTRRAPATTQISFNFRDAPIDTVLEHLSQVAGFVVVKAAPMTGRVTVISKRPISPAEAVTLLNTVLKSNGYAAIQMGRILKVVSVDKAKKGSIPVYFGADPADIQPSDNLITQVIPIRSVDAVKLKTDLQPLVSPDADLTANAGSNTIMMTDTAANIRRVVEIIANIDKPDVTKNTIIVKHLLYADATTAAKVITDIFKANEPAPQQQANGRSRFRRGGQPQQPQEPQGNIARVVASADARTNTVVVTGPPDALKVVQDVLEKLDTQDTQLSSIRVKHLQYADATSAAKLITDIFNSNTRNQSNAPGGNSRQARFFRALAAANGQQNESTVGQVNASADARTNTVVVTGPAETLKVIDEMLDQLDANPASEQTFFIYSVKNGQSQNMAVVLDSLFGVSAPVNNTSYRTNLTGSPGSRSSLGRAAGGFGGSSFGGRGGSGASGFGGRGGSAFGNNSNNNRTTNRQGQTPAANIPANIAGAAADLMGQVYVVADPDTNSLLIATASKYEERVRKIVEMLDRPVPQVLIKVLIAEVTHENASDFGVDFSVLNTRPSGNGQSASTNFNTPQLNGGLLVSVLETNVTATLRALAQANKLDVLSRPYILASNNQLASITVGQIVPIVTNTRVTDTGQTINSISYQDIGIILNVTPHINPDGLVILDVSPEISQISSSTVQISEALTAPVFDLRSADSRVGIQDGQTIVIGGLMEDRKTSQVQKIPLLGDIPVLGNLFKRTIKNKTKTELLIFLTPHVAQQPTELKGMSQEEMEGTQLVPNAVSPGTFQEQIRGMRRGEATRPTTQPDIP